MRGSSSGVAVVSPNRRGAFRDALIAALAALVGSLLGVYIAVLNHQFDVEAYEREQRGAAFTRLVTANRKLTNAEQDVLVRNYLDAQRPPEEAFKAALDLRREFRLAVDVVRAFGPQDQAELSAELDNFIHYHEVVKVEIGNFKTKKTGADMARYTCVSDLMTDESAGLPSFMNAFLDPRDDDGDKPKAGKHILFDECEVVDEDKIEPLE